MEPSATGVSRPSSVRTSSPSTYTLTNDAISSSSTSWCRRAGKRLRSDDLHVRERLAHARPGAHQRAAGAEPGDEDVDAVERRRDLGPGAFVVGARIRLVRVLEGHEVPRLPLRELERQPHSAVRALLAG